MKAVRCLHSIRPFSQTCTSHKTAQHLTLLHSAWYFYKLPAIASTSRGLMWPQWLHISWGKMVSIALAMARLWQSDLLLAYMPEYSSSHKPQATRQSTGLEELLILWKTWGVRIMPGKLNSGVPPEEVVFIISESLLSACRCRILRFYNITQVYVKCFNSAEAL